MNDFQNAQYFILRRNLLIVSGIFWRNRDIFPGSFNVIRDFFPQIINKTSEFFAGSFAEMRHCFARSFDEKSKQFLRNSLLKFAGFFQPTITKISKCFEIFDEITMLLIYRLKRFTNVLYEPKSRKRNKSLGLFENQKIKLLKNLERITEQKNDRQRYLFSVIFIFFARFAWSLANPIANPSPKLNL